jgi:hypothetical protein
MVGRRVIPDYDKFNFGMEPGDMVRVATPLQTGGIV